MVLQIDPLVPMPKWLQQEEKLEKLEKLKEKLKIKI